MSKLKQDVDEILNRTPLGDRRVRNERARRAAFRKIREMEAIYGELPQWVKEEILKCV